MVYPLPPGQGDALEALRREIQAQLDELDSRLAGVRGRLAKASPGSAAAERLKQEQSRLIELASSLLIRLDCLEEPEDDLEDFDDEDGSCDPFDPEERPPF